MNSMPNKLTLHQPASYRICVQGQLDPSWNEYFAELGITCEPNPNASPVTTLTGKLRDQAMLLGMLNYLYGLGLPLLLVERLADNVRLTQQECTPIPTTNEQGLRAVSILINAA